MVVLVVVLSAFFLSCVLSAFFAAVFLSVVFSFKGSAAVGTFDFGVFNVDFHMYRCLGCLLFCRLICCLFLRLMLIVDGLRLVGLQGCVNLM